MSGTIAIAFEDVITQNPGLWATFMKYARLEAHQILVIGENHRYTLEDALEFNGLIHEIHYDRAISMIDYLVNKCEDVYFDENTNQWRTRDPKAWRDVKGRICFEEDVALMIEENYLFASAFNNMITRLEMICKPGVEDMFKEVTRKVKLVNEWFEDYESGFNAYGHY